jgi:hypothetical protein
LDHSTVANLACASAGCHDGVANTTYKSAAHPFTTELCDACHNTIDWKPLGQIQHSQALDVCSNCHNGVAARGKSPTHCSTSLECDQCHDTNGWGTIPNAPACNGTAPPPGGGNPPPPGGGNPSTGNSPPIAVISAPGTGGNCNTNYSFDGSQSYDPDPGGQIVSYQWWVFPQGDATIANPQQAQTVIRFTVSGPKTVRLVVNDGTDDSSPTEVSFNISNMMCM